MRVHAVFSRMQVCISMAFESETGTNVKKKNGCNLYRVQPHKRVENRSRKNRIENLC